MSRKTQHVFIIGDYSENHMKPVNALCTQNAELLTCKVRGTYSYHWVLKAKALSDPQAMSMNCRLPLRC
jgi:hypothetical protein